MIDLRSDTVTKPTAPMRQAMAEAEVGDDVLGDDPTVKVLEQRCAAILGTEAALYMPSGTMTNQVAINIHTRPGDEVLVSQGAHVFLYEAGAPAALSGVTCQLLPGERGTFTAEAVKAAVKPKNPHLPRTRLVCIENTHNRGGGNIWPIEQIAQVAQVAKEAGLKLHLDGARLWNAAVASGIPESQWAGYFDSISVCFSKGLGAPVGSALAGSAEFIEEARRVRKRFGGGMRQSGIIAAGALYALDHQRERLIEDHANAKAFAQGIAAVSGINVDPDLVQTNMVYLDTLSRNGGELAERFDQAGLRMLGTGPHQIRAVANLEVTRADIDPAVQIVIEVMSRLEK